MDNLYLSRQSFEMPLAPKIIRFDQLQSVLNLGRAALEKLMLDDFPQPIRLGPKSRGWLVSEVEAWIEKRAAQRPVAKATEAE